MLKHLLLSGNAKGRILRLFLVLALLFSAGHVAFHELDAGLDEISECQVCQLNHTPTVASSSASVFSTPALLLYRLDFSQSDFSVLFSLLSYGARAPPLF